LLGCCIMVLLLTTTQYQKRPSTIPEINTC
jgi:hypothetical protein